MCISSPMLRTKQIGSCLIWSQVVRAKIKFSCGAGASEWDVSGWITGFLHFTHDGSPRIDPDEEIFATEDAVVLDGVIYVPESLEDVTVGYAKAPLKMVDYPTPGMDTMAYVLAGNVGIEREDREGKVTAQPVSGWFMYAPVDSNHTTGPSFGNRMELEDIAVGIDTCKATGRLEEQDIREDLWDMGMMGGLFINSDTLNYRDIHPPLAAVPRDLANAFTHVSPRGVAPVPASLLVHVVEQVEFFYPGVRPCLTGGQKVMPWAYYPCIGRDSGRSNPGLGCGRAAVGLVDDLKNDFVALGEAKA
ncbi:hypothetical protein FZEAL_9665 [Fusarium zealandicum]|uniref:Uncharacterized protein n=1 Tax=Fusarium zealandicum TaxID=1053134 RepID=A0A8H4U942_9HYPO|nr:hypothetical protein FZEAL_9665 [Fusarium zealandicum]